MKTVCIVGAGPAGLAGAKVLLKTGKFHIKIFEKANRIGGIWALDDTSTEEAFLHPDTPTNLSKFTVAFSDLDWNSIGLLSTQQNAVANGATSKSPAPMFPKAWQVNRYLEAYRQKYIPDDVLQLEHEVVTTRRSTESGKAIWHVTIRHPHGQEAEHDFDHLMLGSGFFSTPRPLSQNVDRIAPNLGLKAIHSSKFRTLSQIFDKPEDAIDKKILLIGGGNSAGEAAAAVAQQLSDAWYSPKTGKHQDLLYKGCKILHVTPRPLYALPPYTPVDENCKAYVPIDLQLYDLKRRPKGPIIAGAGRVPRAVKNFVHGAMQGIVGGDQSDLGSQALKIPPEEPRSAVYVALSESYAEFVRSGVIEVQAGRVKSLNGKEGVIEAEIERDSGDTTEVEEDIGAIIYATGYSPASAINFLPQDVKEELHYDPSSLRLPLILSGWQTTSPQVPDLALLGFYEGPFWPMIEMQARYTAHRWLSPDSSAPEIRAYEEASKLLDLRKTMKARGNDVPQYWFGDYAGYMEEISSFLNLERNNAPFTSDREGCASPARYLSPDSSSSSSSSRPQAQAIMSDLHKTWTACIQTGLYTARAAFRALQGTWTISRTISSKLPTFPSGVLKGTASFHPRKVTAPDFDFEYLYIETGTLHLSNGAEMTARKRYVYRYSELRDELSVWFVKPEKDLEVDYLFHNLEFQPAAKGLLATADHLCVKDMYWTEYSFPMQGISLHGFEKKHTVQGPEKDYVARTEFLRPELKMK